MVEGGQLFAGQATVKGVAAVEQGIHGFLIGEVTLALVTHGPIPVQAKGFQLTQNGIGGTGHFPGRVQIVHADQPFTARVARFQPAGQRSHQGPEMQGAGGGGGETSAIGHKGSEQ